MVKDGKGGTNNGNYCDNDVYNDSSCAAKAQAAVYGWLERNSTIFWTIFKVVLVLLYFAYFGYSMSYK